MIRIEIEAATPEDSIRELLAMADLYRGADIQARSLEEVKKMAVEPQGQRPQQLLGLNANVRQLLEKFEHRLLEREPHAVLHAHETTVRIILGRRRSGGIRVRAWGLLVVVQRGGKEMTHEVASADDIDGGIDWLLGQGEWGRR